MATQNPLESEGVYPLPEAQLDRFLLKVDVPTPSMAEELEIVHRMSVDPPQAQQVISLEQLVQLQQASDAVYVHDAVAEYAVRLVMATREPHQWEVPELAPLVVHGASPRGSLGLVAAARSLALLRGRDHALPEDVAAVAVDVLAHRLVLTYEAIADGVPRRRLVERVLERIAPPAQATPFEDDGAA
jgi:MoxR-like ATPase